MRIPVETTDNNNRFSEDSGISYQRPQNLPPNTTVEIPNSEVTGLVLLAALLGILGNNLLKPLFKVVVDNFKQDSQSSEKIAEILNSRIDKLDAEREENNRIVRDLTNQLTALMEAVKEQSIVSREYRETLTRQGDYLERMIQSLAVIESEMVRGGELFSPPQVPGVKRESTRSPQNARLSPISPGDFRSEPHANR